MIPYDLIITAAHRPHLLEPTLTSLLAQVDQPPARILIHDDAATPQGPGAPPNPARQREETQRILADCAPSGTPVVYTWADPPRGLAGALQVLCQQAASYVLYSQDDFVTVRPLPIRAALAALDYNGLHQIRFNKRATLGQKDTWQGVWRKTMTRVSLGPETPTVPLTVSDHWYFQTGVWRVAPLRAVLAWLHATSTRRALLARTQPEDAINHAFDGQFGSIPHLTVPREHPEDPLVRGVVQRTFIWGPIGEDRYVRHIGGEDPRGTHARSGGVDSVDQAWREIRTYEAHQA